MDYYLHGNPNDPWINETWVYQQQNFDKALATLPVPGQRLTLPADGFDVYSIFYGAHPPLVDQQRQQRPNWNQKRPTIILGNGYDGSQEDIFFALGKSGVESGWNVMTYEGPGQPSVRRNQSIGFIKEWDKVITPILDYLQTREDVDTDRIVLVGFSFSAFLAEQAAAVEADRLAALVLDPPVFDIYAAFTAQLPTQLLQLFESGNKTEFDNTVNAALANSSTPTSLRWGVEQGEFSFNIESPFDFLSEVRDWNISAVQDKLTMPIWVASGDSEQFWAGQAEQVVQALQKYNNDVTVVNYTGVNGFHCQAGAYQTLSADLYGWLGDRFNVSTPAKK